MCVHVCMCVCVHMCMCVCARMHVCVCVCVCVCMCVCVDNKLFYSKVDRLSTVPTWATSVHLSSHYKHQYCGRVSRHTTCAVYIIWLCVTGVHVCSVPTLAVAVCDRGLCVQCAYPGCGCVWQGVYVCSVPTLAVAVCDQGSMCAVCLPWLWLCVTKGLCVQRAYPSCGCVLPRVCVYSVPTLAVAVCDRGHVQCSIGYA